MLSLLFLCWISFQDEVPKHSVDQLLAMDPKDAMTYISGTGETAYDYGINLVYAGNIHGAGRFFKHFTLKYPGDHSLLYGRAWLHWALEEYEQALRDADFLVRQSKDPLLLARAHLLIAQIHKWQENLVRAKKHYELSLELYTPLNKTGGIFRCLMGMAYVAYLGGKPAEGDALVERAQKIKPTDKPEWEARVFEMKSDTAYLRRDWAKALYYSERAYEGYASQFVLSALWHQSRMALCHAMLGDYEEAWRLGRSVDLKLAEMPVQNQHILHFHSLLWILHARCSDYDVERLRKPFKDWAKDKPTALRELEYFESCDCPF